MVEKNVKQIVTNNKTLDWKANDCSFVQRTFNSDKKTIDRTWQNKGWNNLINDRVLDNVVHT